MGKIELKLIFILVAFCGSFANSLNDSENQDLNSLKLHLKHRSIGTKKTMIESITRDLIRLQTLNTKITKKKTQTAAFGQIKKHNPNIPSHPATLFSVQLTTSVESGETHGSGEYFIDVYIGTPPRHYNLILDTGSDLNWIQCNPCDNCFKQNIPYFNKISSSSYRSISCKDPKCDLVVTPDPPEPCENNRQTCPYFYWYGDTSNTTGDLALETFTLNLTTTVGGSVFHKLNNVMFGCGHSNIGRFGGSAGVLGLGKGPLSFSSQMKALYGHSFSYCLVDRNTNASITSKLIFEESLSHPNSTYTSLVTMKENPNIVETFYYVKIKSVLVGGEVVNVSSGVWNLTSDGSGGSIIDSGTTLSYFTSPAYNAIKAAFMRKIKGVVVHDFPMLSPCYNVSGGVKLNFPSFSILFQDGAKWDFPVENSFIRIESEGLVCLAIMEMAGSDMSIIGNYQQQNFHIMYDTKMSRIGFAPRKCAHA